MNNLFEIKSSHPPQILVNKLKNQTIIQHKFKYLRWLNSGEWSHFYGCFNGNSFKLSPCIEGKNFFTPVIVGEILPTPEGSLLRYRVTLSPDMKKFYLFIWILLFTYLVTLLDVLTGGSALYGSRLFFYLFPIGLSMLVATFATLNRYHIKRHQENLFAKFSEVTEE